MNICVVTDNEYIYNEFNIIIADIKYSKYKFDFFYSYSNKVFNKKYNNSNQFKKICLNEKNEYFFNNYDLFLSLHCKQLFPVELVENYRCINIHPGYNPYNRGWFPQVFSIINKLPIGVTIHEMDSQLDHGAILMQEKLSILDYETSYDVYNKIQQLEIRMLKENLESIISGNYNTLIPQNIGNINYKEDFNNLCRIDLDKLVTFREAIDYFRAMTFKDCNNAYFYDQNGEKIYIQILLSKEDN